MAINQIEIEGLDEVVRTLQRVGVDVADGLEMIAQAGAEVMARATTAQAPGDIAGSIVQETTEKSGQRVSVDVGPDADHFYALFLEFGTQPHEIRPLNKKALNIAGTIRAKAMHPGSAPRPFMRPAFDGNQDATEAAMGQATAVAGKIR